MTFGKVFVKRQFIYTFLSVSEGGGCVCTYHTKVLEMTRPPPVKGLLEIKDTHRPRVLR